MTDVVATLAEKWAGCHAGWAEHEIRSLLVEAFVAGWDAHEDSNFRCGRPVAGEERHSNDSRERLGRLVRETWVKWASEQPDPKPTWLIGWDELDAGQRDVDMRIGEAVAADERKRLTEPAGTRRCPRDHKMYGRDMAMDRIPPQYGGGWACPGILLDASECGFELDAEGDMRRPQRSVSTRGR